LTDLIVGMSPNGPGGAATAVSKDHIIEDVEQALTFSIGLAME